MRRAREKREREVAERGETSPADAGEESTQQIPPPPPKRWITVTAEEAFDAFKQGECVVVDVRHFALHDLAESQVRIGFGQATYLHPELGLRIDRAAHDRTCPAHALV